MSNVVTTRLDELEDTIERGLTTFVDVGQALLEIRDSRLYRESHGTFEDYCKERWGMDRRNANRHIEAASVVGELGSNDPKPTNVAQTRELAPLKDDPEQMAEAWDEASADGEPTAEKVRAAVKPRRPRPQPDGPAHYAPDMGADDAEENLRTQSLHWFEQGLVVKGLLDTRRLLEPRSTEDRKAIKREAATMERVARRLKEACE